MYTIDLTGKHALVMGVANHRSLAWAIAQTLHQAGATLCFTYLNDRMKPLVEKTVQGIPDALILECDVTRDDTIDAVAKRLESEWGSVDCLLHGIAFANKNDLENDFVSTSREGFQMALDISAYSLLNVTNRLRPLLEEGGASIVTLSYLAAERAVPAYNVMGSAKAVLEQIVRQLAYELGPQNIRVNAISAGPANTLAARGISGFNDMLKKHAEGAPLKRNITKEEVGTAGLFLLSEMSAGMTGEIMYVDAGFNIMAGS
jgi:enoyl-[acyl-carrier protein] reductase I